jgi:hypothetical protein
MVIVVNDLHRTRQSIEFRILARNAVPDIPYLNLGRTSRLHTPRFEPIISLSRPLPYEGIARNYSVNSAFE